MSLVGSTDSSNTLQRTSNIYSLNGRDDNSGLTAHILGSDKLSTMYSTDLYEDNNYEKYLFDSMAAELDEASSNPLMLHLSLAEISTHHLNSELPFLENLSPDSECYNEKQIRLQLQELERALLSDNDIADDDMFISQCTEISSELANPIQNELLQNSSVESPSLDSKLSSISCKTTKTPQELLLDYAAMLSEGNIEGTSVMIIKSMIINLPAD